MRCNSISAVSALLEAAEACNAVRKAELPDTLRYLYDGCMSQSYYHRVAVHVEDEHSLALLRERVQLHTVLERGFLHAASDGLEELVEYAALLLCTASPPPPPFRSPPQNCIPAQSPPPPPPLPHFTCSRLVTRVHLLPP